MPPDSWDITQATYVISTYYPTSATQNIPFTFTYSLPNGNPILTHVYYLMLDSQVLATYTCTNSADTNYVFQNVSIHTAGSSILFTIFDTVANIVVDSNIALNVTSNINEQHYMHFGGGSNSNGQFWYGGQIGFPGFLYKKNVGVAGRRSTKLGAGGNVTSNQETYLYNKFK
jgi:hypothetical protein